MLYRQTPPVCCIAMQSLQSTSYDPSVHSALGSIDRQTDAGMVLPVRCFLSCHLVETDIQPVDAEWSGSSQRVGKMVRSVTINKGCM